jgi:hypothetical protein
MVRGSVGESRLRGRCGAPAGAALRRWRSPPAPAVATAALSLFLVLGGCRAAEDRQQAPRELPSPAPPGSGQPNLSPARDGSILLSWIEPDAAGGHRLSFSRLVDGEWGNPRVVATGEDWFVNWADFPSVVELPDRTLAAHYLQRRAGAERGYHYDVRVVLSTDGGGSWSVPVTPHGAGVPAEYGFVSLFAHPAGDLGVVWLDGRMYDPSFGATEEMALRARTITRAGELGAELVVDERVCDCCQTSVALTSRGPLVAYRGRSPGEIRDVAVSRFSGTGWTQPVVVHHDGWKLAACPVNGPSAAAEGDHAAVAWFTAAEDIPRVLVAFSADAGASFSPPVRVDEGDPLGRASVALLPDGTALVVWMERVGSEDAAVRYRLVSPDGVVSPPRTVGMTTAARASGFPHVVATDRHAVFAWTETAPVPIVRTAVLRLETGR